MTKPTNRKLMAAGAVIAGVLACGATFGLASSAGKQERLAFYTALKDSLELGDRLSAEGTSYSLFSGNLTIRSPELRLLPAHREPAAMLDSLAGLSSGGEEALAQWSDYQIRQAVGPGAAALYARAEAIELGRDGDDRQGEIRLAIRGLDMGNPYVGGRGQELLLLAQVADEIRPRTAGDGSGSGYTWLPNLANQLRFTGGWLTGATGLIGSRIDLELSIRRAADGSGAMRFVSIHRNAGSEIGRIERQAEFAALPELQETLGFLQSMVNAYAVAGAGLAQAGSAVLGETIGAFARKVRVGSYALSYRGFAQLEQDWRDWRAAGGAPDIEPFCQALGLSEFSAMRASRLRHDDSECAIAGRLIRAGEYVERYRFGEDRSLFAELFVNRGYEFAAH